ncbi:MAG: DUF6531 domain-containing protein, partial [Methylomonas sp.]
MKKINCFITRHTRNCLATALIAFCIAPVEDCFAGGYVDGTDPIDPASFIAATSPGASIVPDPATANILPTFNNDQFTNLLTVGSVNNDPIVTPSTDDPVSTVTGNNYHDETDFQIHGRNGLNYVFTRTYNSAPSSTTVDMGMGFGWVHSYGMKLVSNDFGSCPNCTSAQASGNGDGKTGSITYTDERGGQQNFAINQSTFAVTNPTGIFSTLTVTPGSYTINGYSFTLSAGYYALTFRNGVQYLFQDLNYSTSADMRSKPGRTANLVQISDPYGNLIKLSYTKNSLNTGWNLTGIADNLNIANRTGLVLKYNTDSPVNHLVSISDWSSPTVRTWAYGYISGNLTVYTNPLSQTTSYSYQTGNLLTQITKQLQRNGKNVATTFNYYQNGRTLNDQDSLGDKETLDYDLFRMSARVTDPNGNIREYDYDNTGRMIKLIDADGGQLYFKNQSDGLRYQKYDALGYGTQYNYNTTANSWGTASNNGGNVSQVQDALGKTITTTYGIYDQITSVTDKNLNTTNTSYFSTASSGCGVIGKPSTDSIAQLTSGGVTVNNAVLRSYCWNTDGTLNTLTEYPTAGAATHPRTTTYTYDTTAHLNVATKTVSGAGVNIVTTYTYDNLGRKLTESLSRSTYPNPITASTTATAPVLLTNSYQYDALDRVIQVITPDSIVRQTIYDANGQIAQQITYYPSTDGRQGCLAPAAFNGGTYVQCVEAAYQYDAADRKIQSTDVLGNNTFFAYDNNSNLIKITDANGHVTQYQYDSMNRRTAVINGNGQKTTTTYDLAGHATSVTDANGNTTCSLYDPLGRLTQLTDPLGNTTTYKYDANGNKTCMTDANTNPISTNACSQPVAAQTSCTVSYTYDQLNRPTQITDALYNSTLYTYNLYGSRVFVIDANAGATSYQYDDLGRLAQTTDPLFNIESYVNDEAGNVIQMTDRKGQATLYLYDVMNRNTQAFHMTDTSQEFMTYNSIGDLTGIQNAV